MQKKPTSIITDCPYICAPNIMDTPDYTTKTVVLDMTGKTVIKAGTPISADGKVANDETAIGILLQDCHACLGTCRGLVVISGRIKQDVAKDYSGVTISDEAKAALINITFTGDGARAGGGGGVTTLHINVTAVDEETGAATFTADKTVQEMRNVIGPTWCVVTFAAGIFGESEITFNLPPAWAVGEPSFGSYVQAAHDAGGNNKTLNAVRGNGATPGAWIFDVTVFGS